ncbi:hypothetical protein L211DRAFT_603730 [Terfezia boudieri ATCC MYA-4762]|uniref:TNFR-Cys domain-containing protein n=1 Tax=Terfezia boudieri ATCC MYA-4762 TaxID=1051890 RepID=A0A3N4M0X2_9PEZI|nr:hypothetical protein L211DRAFT_603730 [Terfezia boudieri ATCC MYA-4762]
MKLHSGVALFIAASFLHTAAGLLCRGACAACWKDGVPGVDVILHCDVVCNSCPVGFHGLHCAKRSRCRAEKRMTLELDG